jgi:hypothetical protein
MSWLAESRGPRAGGGPLEGFNTELEEHFIFVERNNVKIVLLSTILIQ